MHLFFFASISIHVFTFAKTSKKRRSRYAQATPKRNNNTTKSQTKKGVETERQKFICFLSFIFGLWSFRFKIIVMCVPHQFIWIRFEMAPDLRRG